MRWTYGRWIGLRTSQADSAELVSLATGIVTLGELNQLLYQDLTTT